VIALEGRSALGLVHIVIVCLDVVQEGQAGACPVLEQVEDGQWLGFGHGSFLEGVAHAGSWKHTKTKNWMQFENSIRSTDLARKQAYKAVYAPSLDVEWSVGP
jgi:hypothetical protein